jgi:hypothetical protein
MPDQENARLEYLEVKMIALEQENFRQVWLELCKVASRHLQLVWQLLRLDATMGARALLQRSDIFATFAGEAVLKWECRTVAVDKLTQVYWGYKVNETCYAELPVKIDG